ncbi:MAG: hypothetical protein WCJ28_04665, partial [Actinomycetota bacterium]
MRRKVWLSAIVTALLGFALAALFLGMGQKTAKPRSVVSVYSDSLGYEVGPNLDAILSPKVSSLKLYSFPGTAMCYWSPTMAKDAARRHPSVVVMEFAGTPFSACAQGAPWGSAAFFAEVKRVAVADARVFLHAGASHVAFVSIPVSLGGATQANRINKRLMSIYHEVVRELGPRAYFIEAARAVETPSGKFTWKLPCLLSEVAAHPSLCTGGTVGRTPVNVVRQADGAHFCLS